MPRSLSLMSYPVYCWQLTSPGSRSMGPGTAAAPWGNCHCTSDTAAPDTASLTAVTDSTGPCWPAGQKERRNWEIIWHKTDKQNGSVQLVKIFFLPCSFLINSSKQRRTQRVEAPQRLLKTDINSTYQGLQYWILLLYAVKFAKGIPSR